MTDAVFYKSYPDTYTYIYAQGNELFIRRRLYRYPSQTDILCSDCSGSFCAWNEGEIIYLIYFSTQNKVRCIRICENDRTVLTLSRARGDTVICGFDVNFTQYGDELYYAACADGKYYLLKCRLDNNDPAEAVATLSHPDFYIDGDALFYTDITGALTVYERRKARHFILAEYGTMCHSINSPGGRLYTYKKDGAIYLSDIRLCDADDAEYPILVSEPDKLMVQWRSKNKLCYCISYTGGKSWSDVRKLIYSDLTPILFCVFTGGERHFVYGTRKKHEITLFERAPAGGGKKHAGSEKHIRLRLERIEKELTDIKTLLTDVPPSNGIIK